MRGKILARFFIIEKGKNKLKDTKYYT